MRAEWAEAHAKLLSVPPLFDEAMAGALVTSLSNELAPGSGFVSDILTPLRLTGLLAGEAGCWYIAEAARSEFREELRKENTELFRNALDISLKYMENGFGSTLRRVLGSRNSRLLIAVLTVGSSADHYTSFDNVVRELGAVHRLGRESGEAIARFALSQLPPASGRTRQTEFLLGMEKWRTSQRAAVAHFERVIDTEVIDLAFAVSTHLIGVSMVSRGDLQNAMVLLKQSVAALRQLRDPRELAQVLTSVGIAEREMSSNLLAEADNSELDESERSALIADADVHFQAAQDALDEAMGLAHEADDPHLEAGAHLELAACFARWDDITAAISESERARSIMHHDDRNYLRVLTQLGALYRQNDDYTKADAVLTEAAEVAVREGTAIPTLARLLNVQAVTDRKLGRINHAQVHAESSVRFGRILKDERHLGHSLHILALITIDTARDQSDLMPASELLSESRRMLESVRDSAGLRIIGEANLYLERRRDELDVGNKRDQSTS